MSWGPLQKHHSSLSPGHTWRLCECRHIQTLYEECGLFFFNSQLTLWFYSFPAHLFGLSDVRGENTLPPCPRGMWLLPVTSGRGQLWLLLRVTHGPSHASVCSSSIKHWSALVQLVRVSTPRPRRARGHVSRAGSWKAAALTQRKAGFQASPMASVEHSKK